MRQPTFAFLLLLTLSTVVFGQCPTNGLALTLDGQRLGDPFALNLYGSPGVSGLLAIDDTSGPVSTPIGTICLGLTPNLQLQPFTLDFMGHYSINGVLPANPSLVNYTAFLQAAAADPNQVGGFAVSNGVGFKLRPPRIFFINPGFVSPFGSQPGSWCAYDAINDAVGTLAIPLASSVLDAITIPSLGWVAFLLGNSTIQCFDASNGAPTLSMPVPSTPGFPSLLKVEGTTLYVLYYGVGASPFGSGTPGGLRSYSLPSGTPGFFTPLASGNPDEMLILPNTGLAYLRLGTTIALMNILSGGQIGSITLGGFSGGVSDWVLAGTTLYCLMPGTAPGLFGGGSPPSLDAIDTLTHLPLFANPVSQGGIGAATMLRYGPGQFGNALYYYDINLTLPLVQVNPSTLLPINGIGTSNGLSAIELSPGGTEWLMLCNTGACAGSPSLQVMYPQTQTFQTLTPLLAPVELLVSLPSATVRRACTVYNNNLVLPFSTDPSSPPFTTIALPITSSTMRVVVD